MRCYKILESKTLTLVNKADTKMKKSNNSNNNKKQEEQDVRLNEILIDVEIGDIIYVYLSIIFILNIDLFIRISFISWTKWN